MNRPSATALVATAVLLLGGCAASKGGGAAANARDGAPDAGGTGSAGTTATDDANPSATGAGGASAAGAAGTEGVDAAGSSDAGAAGATTSGTAGTAGADAAVACETCELGATVAGTCFQTSSTANADTTDPTKFGCNGFSAVDRAECEALLACIRANHCGKNDDATPCLCGALDPTSCASTAITALGGPCRDQYVAAADSGNVFSLFFSTDSPIGIANNLFTCDVDATCACR